MFFHSHKFALSPINRKRNVSMAEQLFNIVKDKLPAIKKLEDFYNYVKSFDCELKRNCKNTVIYRGQLSSIMVVGEAPGADEDEVGLPFVGKSGQLVDRMLNAINLDPREVYITNVVYWRPPENRTPTKKEVEMCLPMLKKHIELVAPKIILLLGSVALKSLFPDLNISQVRGQLLDFNGTKCLATFHPSYILRLPQYKGVVWDDLKQFRQHLDKLISSNIAA